MRRLERVDWLFAAACAAVVAPVALLAARLSVGAPADFVASGDISLLELRLREIGSLPLLGPYSRWEVFHPGPSGLYLLAPLYWLTGAGRVSVLLAGGLLTSAMLLGSLAIARALGGRALLLLTAAALALLEHGMGVERLLSPWNASTNLVLLVLVLLAAWWLAAGERRALPVLAVAATVAVQSHYGYGPVIALPALLAVGWFAARNGPRALGGRLGLVTAAALALLWAPPLLQELANRDPGNVGGLLHLNRESGLPTLGVRAGLDAARPHFGLVPEWALARMGPGIGDAYGRLRGIPWLLLAALAGAGAWAARRGRRDPAVAAGLALAAIAAGILSLSQIRGELYPWLTWFLGPLAMVGWLAVAWCVLPKRAAVAAGGAVLAVAAVLSLAQAARTDVSGLRTRVGLDSAPAVAAPARRIAAAAPRGRVTIDCADADWGDLVETAALAMSRAGADVRVSGRLAHPFGYELRDRGERGRARLQFVRDGSGTPPPAGASVVAREGGYVVYRLENGG